MKNKKLKRTTQSKLIRREQGGITILIHKDIGYQVSEGWVYRIEAKLQENSQVVIILSCGAKTNMAIGLIDLEDFGGLSKGGTVKLDKIFQENGFNDLLSRILMKNATIKINGRHKFLRFDVVVGQGKGAIGFNCFLEKSYRSGVGDIWEQVER